MPFPELVGTDSTRLHVKCTNVYKNALVDSVVGTVSTWYDRMLVHFHIVMSKVWYRLLKGKKMV